jgi:uncharacterized protein YciI
MPLFAIVAQDRPDAGSLRADTRPRHLVHLEGIVPQTVVAGPTLGESGAPTGSIIIADFADLAAAQAFAAADPYAQAGLFASVAVSAFRQVFP